MTALYIDKANGYAGASFPNEGSLFLRRKNQALGVGPGILCLHGRTGNCLQYQPYQSKAAIGYFSNLLALEGFRVLAIDDMGGVDWGSQDSTDRINDAITYLQGALGAKAGKVGIMGWSMGGMAALNWISKTSVKHACSWLWAPATDLAWAHSQAAWTAEIDAAYADDEGYATAALGGNNPAAAPQNYRGVGPIRCAHAQDDSTIPYQKTVDFVAAVNDPTITLRSISAGGHTNLFSDVTDLELVSFFRNNLGIPAR